MTGKLAGGLIAFVAATMTMGGLAEAAQCGNTSAGFAAWKVAFAAEAKGRGIKARGISALMGTQYSAATIRADRAEKFNLSLSAFMARRGAAGIAARGKSLKRANAALFASIEQRYGVPPGPLIA